MTKAEIVRRVANDCRLSRKRAQVIVEHVFESMRHTLKRGEGIELRGFGVFRFRQKVAKDGRNPKTGAAVRIPTRQAICFKPGKKLQQALNVSSDPEQQPVTRKSKSS